MTGILLASTCGLVAKGDDYEQVNRVANDAKYNPQIVDETLLNAWDNAIRLAELGGHFWITRNGNSTSNQDVGDVGGTPLFMDDLALIDLPRVGDQGSTPTGVIFNQGLNFEITQSHANGDIIAPAKFVFVGDDGTITACTERNNDDGTIDRPLDAVKVFDASSAGQAYLGSAVSAKFDRLYTADFGTNPHMRVFDGRFNHITASVPFVNPFDEADIFFGRIVSVSEPTSACLFRIAFVPLMSHPRITTKKDRKYVVRGTVILTSMQQTICLTPCGCSVRGEHS